jgi:hypothetical protein
MTSISAASSSGYQSPLHLLQAELRSEVNSGAVSSSDQSALSSALTDINSALQGGGSGGSTGSTDAPPSNVAPGDIKSKIDSLIAGEVSSGKLTAQQGSELQGVFQNAFGSGANGSSGTVAADATGATAAFGPPPSPGGPGGPAAWAVQAACITVTMAAAITARLLPALRRLFPPRSAPTVRRRRTHPSKSCSSFCNPCKARCRRRQERPTAQTAVRL